MDDPLKMYCIVNPDVLAKLGGNRGKMLAQAGHAYLHAWWDAAERHPDAARAYADSQAAAKIALIAPSYETLRDLVNDHWPICGVSLVTDATRTVFTEPTVTCLGIGPIRVSQRSELLASLKVFL